MSSWLPLPFELEIGPSSRWHFDDSKNGLLLYFLVSPPAIEREKENTSGVKLSVDQYVCHTLEATRKFVQAERDMIWPQCTSLIIPIEDLCCVCGWVGVTGCV